MPTPATNGLELRANPFCLLGLAMIPYVLPFGVFIVLVVLRRISPLAARYTISDAAAWSLSALLVLSGSAHFVGLRDDLIRMVPPAVPHPDIVITVTGVFELLGAVGLIFKSTRTSAGILLAVLFVALLPANIYAAHQGLTIGGKPVAPLARRVPEQLGFIALALLPVFTARRNTTAHARSR